MRGYRDLDMSCEYRERLDKMIINPVRRLSYQENFNITGGGKMCGGGSSWYVLDQKQKMAMKEQQDNEEKDGGK